MRLCPLSALALALTAAVKVPAVLAASTSVTTFTTCSTRLVQGTGSTKLPPASTVYSTVFRTVVPLATSTKVLTLPQQTSTTITPIIETKTVQLPVAYVDVTVTSTNFFATQPTTILTAPTLTPTLTFVETQTTTQFVTTTTYTQLQALPTIFPAAPPPTERRRWAGGRDLFAEAVQARAARKKTTTLAKQAAVALCKRRVVQCTPVVRTTSTVSVAPRRTVTTTSTSTPALATFLSSVTGTVTTTLAPSATNIHTVQTALTITLPTQTFTTTPTASPSIVYETLVNSVQQTVVVAQNALCNPTVLAQGRTNEVDPYLSQIVTGQLVIDMSTTTFPDLGSCCSAVAALDGAIGFTYYGATSGFAGLCRGLIVDFNADPNGCDATQPQTTIIDQSSAGTGVIDGLLGCGNTFAPPN